MRIKARYHFGGRLHSREAGIKPLFQRCAKGFGGIIYLTKIMVPSIVNLWIFGTYKATLPAIGRLMKVCRAAIVPLFPAVYCHKTHQLKIIIREPMDDIEGQDDRYTVRAG